MGLKKDALSWKVSLFLLILTLYLSNNVFAEMIVSDSGVEYDSEILDILSQNDSMRVLVRLTDNSGFPATSVNEKNEWFKPVIETVLNNLSKDEFELDNRRSDGFSGWITLKGFNKLINDSRVKTIISSPSETGAGSAINETPSQKNSSQEPNNITEKKFFQSIWFALLVIIILILICYILIRKK